MRGIDRALRSKAGFTLIELMLVIVVIGILAVVAIPRISHVRTEANNAVIKSELHNIQTALEMYYTENNSFLTVPEGETSLTIDKDNKHGLTLNDIQYSYIYTENPDSEHRYKVITASPMGGNNYYVLEGEGIQSEEATESGE
ncbi:MAG: type II secretion system protein [Halanaerobium sp.]|nr:type II secretion system protein [Halanaerobium sp.]